MKKDIIKEQGSVLLVALMVLFILTILSTKVFLTSITNMQISSNYKLHITNLINSEGVIETVPGAIRRSISLQSGDPYIRSRLLTNDKNSDNIDDMYVNENNKMNFTGIDIDTDDNNEPDFTETVMGYADSKGNPWTSKFETVSQLTTVEVDIVRNGAEHTEGSAVASAGGYEGMDITGGNISFTITGTGDGEQNSQSHVLVRYLCLESNGGCL